MLSRAVNPLSPEILDFMNAEQRIILLCDWDERIAVPAANLLFEKGADNVVVLSGGGADVTSAAVICTAEVVAILRCSPTCLSWGFK